MPVAYERDMLIRELRDGVVELHFVDNGRNYMVRGTLWNKYLPPIPENAVKINESLRKNPKLLVVWDVVTPGWRSILVDAITYVESLTAEY